MLVENRMRQDRVVVVVGGGGGGTGHAAIIAWLLSLFSLFCASRKDERSQQPGNVHGDRTCASASGRRVVVKLHLQAKLCIHPIEVQDRR